jgi:hypothetical protein
MNIKTSALANMVRTTTQGTAAGGLPTGNPIPSIQMNDLEPGVYTIQFTVIPPGDGQGFAAYAIVTWKVEGQQVTRMVSVFSGAVISGVAESVDVKIVDVSQIGTNGFPTTPQKYQVGVSLSKGSRATTMQPATLVTQLDEIQLDAGATTSYLIPSDAGVISALVTSASLTTGVLPTDILVIQSTTGLVAHLCRWYPIEQSPGWIPLFGGAVNLEIFNTGSAKAGVNVIWGIEG